MFSKKNSSKIYFEGNRISRSYTTIPASILEEEEDSPTESALIHPYPGSMPAYLASRLVSRYSSPNSFVFDPFCGTGCVPLEALKLGRRAMGCDLLELPVRIANVASRLPHPDKILHAWHSVLRRMTMNSSRFPNVQGGFTEGSLREWLHHGTLSSLNCIRTQIGYLQNPCVERVFLLMMAGSLISLSKRRNRGTLHWGWIADNVKPRPNDLIEVDVVEELNRRVYRLYNFLRSTASHVILSQHNKRQDIAFVHNWLRDNDLQQRLKGSVDLVVTSPPYPYSIDYALALRLSCYFLGLEIEGSRRHEIGARYKRKRKFRTKEYLTELSIAFRNLSGLVRRGGFAVFVLPDPDQYRSTLGMSWEDWRRYIEKGLFGKWVLSESGFRPYSRRRIVHTATSTRRDSVLAFEKVD